MERQFTSIEHGLHSRSRSWVGLRYCLQPSHLRRTAGIAVTVGLLLTAINQLDVIVSGDAGAATWVKSASNFLVPFVVANLGLLSGAREARL